MKLDPNELHFIKTAIEQVAIKGKDAPFVAEILIKVNKDFEQQIKAVKKQKEENNN